MIFNFCYAFEKSGRLISRTVACGVDIAINNQDQLLLSDPGSFELTALNLYLFGRIKTHQKW